MTGNRTRRTLMYQTSDVDKRLSLLLCAVVLLASTTSVHSLTSSEASSTVSLTTVTTTATIAASTRTTTTTTTTAATDNETSTTLSSTATTAAPTEGDARLAGSSLSNEGRLEVYVGGKWRTICVTSNFHYVDAGVVCNSLGYGYKGSEVGSQYGTGTSPVWNDNINCVGNEKSIADCPTEKKSIQCGGGVVSVSCGTSPVQYGPLSNLENCFFVSDKVLDNVYQVDAVTGDTSQLLPFGTTTYPYALAYDSSNELLYWSDFDDHSINMYSLLTNNNTVVYRDSLDRASYAGLAIDTEGQKIYFTDSANQDGKVGELSTNGTDYRVLISYTDSTPHAIVFDDVNRILYWTDVGTVPGIYRSPVDNPAQEIVVAGDIKTPNALTIDFTAGIMYWGDAGLNIIEKAYINGTERDTLLEQPNLRTYNFAFYNDYIYFTSYASSTIDGLDIAKRSVFSISSALNFETLQGIVYVPPKATTSTTTSSTLFRTSPSYTSPTGGAAGVSGFDTNMLIIVVLSCIGGVIFGACLLICYVSNKLRRRRNRRAAVKAQQRQIAEKMKQKLMQLSATRTFDYPTDNIYAEINMEYVCDENGMEEAGEASPGPIYQLVLPEDTNTDNTNVKVCDDKNTSAPDVPKREPGLLPDYTNTDNTNLQIIDDDTNTYHI